MKRSGISAAVISEASGHSSEATTRAYLDKFEQTEIDLLLKGDKRYSYRYLPSSSATILKKISGLM